MSGDLEARVVQAAREAVSVHVPPWASMGQNGAEGRGIWDGVLDGLTAVHFAILGARAALVEIERYGVIMPTARRPTETE